MAVLPPIPSDYVICGWPLRKALVAHCCAITGTRHMRAKRDATHTTRAATNESGSSVTVSNRVRETQLLRKRKHRIITSQFCTIVSGVEGTLAIFIEYFQNHSLGNNIENEHREWKNSKTRTNTNQCVCYLPAVRCFLAA